MLKKLIIFIAIASCAATAIYWYSQLSPIKTQLVQPTRGTAVNAVYATGTVEPVNWSKLSTPDGGKLAELLKDEGDTVKKGDIIARFDDQLQRSEMQRLQAQAVYLKKELDRQKALSNRDFSSLKNYERIKSEYDSILASQDAASKRQYDTMIIAPMDGEVLKKNIEVGEYAKSGDTVFWVGRPTPLQIIAEVDEEDIPLVEIGQKALIKADAFASKVFEGWVSKIIPKGDPVNKVFLAEIILPEDTKLLIGMTTEVNLIAEEKEDVLLLPSSAVSDGTHVFVVREGKAVKTPVEIGIRGEKSVEILTGIGEGDTVVLSPPQGMADGARVAHMQKKP